MTAVLEPQTIQITEPGVYDIPEDVYFADPVPGGSLSASGAKKLLPPSCPALFDWERRNPPPPKRAFDIGHAAHKLVLGVGAELATVDAKDWKTKAARDKAAELRAEGKIPLLTHELAMVKEMAAALRRDKLAASLFNPARGRPEQSLFWVDDMTGIWRRARLDWLPTPSGRLLIAPDYKSAASANPTKFAKAVHDFGYHIQDAWYLDGIRALGLADEVAFVFVAQEKTPPYLVSTVQLDVNAERIGRELGRKAIDLYVRCTEAGEWPGYTTDIAEISLPGWAERAHDNP